MRTEPRTVGFVIASAIASTVAGTLDVVSRVDTSHCLLDALEGRIAVLDPDVQGSHLNILPYARLLSIPGI